MSDQAATPASTPSWDGPIGHVVTSGTFTLDGETFDVDNNVWAIGDDRECIVLDAPHDVDAIQALVGDRELRAIVCTHAHDDHVRVAPELRKRTGAPIWLHPAEKPLWDLTHPGLSWDEDIDDGKVIKVGDLALRAILTPGHSPGAMCFYAPDLDVLFSGDTLFQGGPGATGRSFSDKPTILTSIRERLLVLPEKTVVHTGHGDDTTIAAERDNVH